MNTCSCTFSISIVQSRATVFILARRYRPTAIMGKFQRGFVSQNFPDGYNAPRRYARYGKCALRERADKRASNSEKGSGSSETILQRPRIQSYTILRNINGIITNILSKTWEFSVFIKTRSDNKFKNKNSIRKSPKLPSDPSYAIIQIRANHELFGNKRG